MSTSSKHRRRVRASRGAAVVELAITAPVLFMLVFGMIEVGQALMVKQILANAARDGARSAVLEGSTVADVKSQVEDYLEESDVSGVTVSVTPDPLSSAEGGDPVTVTVNVPFSSLSWLNSPFFLSNVKLESSAVMRREVFTSSPSAEP